MQLLLSFVFLLIVGSASGLKVTILSAAVLRVSWEASAASSVTVTATSNTGNPGRVIVEPHGAVITGLTPGATYTVNASGGTTASEAVTMPLEVGASGAAGTWSGSTWTRSGGGLGRLPCAQDHVVLAGTQVVTLDTPALLQSLTLRSGAGLAFPLIAPTLALPALGDADACPETTVSPTGPATTTTTTTVARTTPTTTTAAKTTTTITIAEVLKDDETGGGSPIATIAAAAGAGVALVVVIIVVVVCRKKRRKTSPTLSLAAEGPRGRVEQNPVYLKPQAGVKSMPAPTDDPGYLQVEALASTPAAQAPQSAAAYDAYALQLQRLVAHIINVVAPMVKQQGRATGAPSVKELPCPRILSRSHIKIKNELSSGNFGVVHKADFYDEKSARSYEVAVKLVKNAEHLRLTEPLKLEQEARNLEQEACIHALMDSPFIVKLIGLAPARGQGVISPWVVVELMSEGGLDKLIKKKHANNTLTYAEQLLWAGDAAQGIEHIHTKGVVHRDIAARNVLATLDPASGTVRCKVSDLGLARELDDGYYLKNTSWPKPVRWMAPEALADNAKFSSRSDVYSFAMLLVELTDGAKFPFSSIHSNQEVAVAVRRGERPGRPAQCSAALFQLMSDCWAADPYQRASMSEVVGRLRQLWQAETASAQPPQQPKPELPAVVQRTIKLEGGKCTEVAAANVYDEAEPSALPGQAPPFAGIGGAEKPFYENAPSEDYISRPTHQAPYDLGSEAGSSAVSRLPPYDNATGSVQSSRPAHQAPYELASAPSPSARTEANPEVAVSMFSSNQPGSSSL